MESKCDFLDDALHAVFGDLTQTLGILLEFYKTESNMCCRRALDIISQKTKSTTLQVDSYLDELHMKIQNRESDAGQMMSIGSDTFAAL
jgi:hypothetical protein